ncbi:MAG: hypothetical protein ACR2NV_10620 [Thermoleophilaceae bacterium]
MRSSSPTPRLRAPRPRRALGLLLAPVLASAAFTGVAQAQEPAPPASTGDPSQPTAAPASNPLQGRAMWIWIVKSSSGGDPAKIADRAKRHGINTVIVKAVQGSSYMPQFNSGFVRALKARGLRVCAYGRLLGAQPASEATQAARAVREGAECFVIDAEAEYDGKFRQARTYISTLRRAVGAEYPLGFTSFPYVSLHRRVPYRVFLGPGGAQYNLPQMYWRAIGDSPSAVFARTYRENRGFGRPIYPLGQAYYRPPLSQIRQFKRLAVRYNAPGVSWWSWQAAGEREFGALGGR